MLVRSYSTSSLPAPAPHSFALPLSPQPSPRHSCCPLQAPGLPSPIMSPTAFSPGRGPVFLPSSPPQAQSFTSPTKPTPSTPNSKNYHPYLIQSTSSSLLTRTNSSPAQPLSASPWGHRSSKSMNSLNHILSPPSTPNTKTKDEENRRRSMDSPSRPAPMRRSGTLPDFLLASTSGEKRTPSKELHLPLNPKAWTPSDLAQYLGQTLRTGGPDGHGQVLPAPLVEDIKSWVLRQRVSGRAFMRGSADGWGSTRPPPFLPLLQSIARKLRRNSLGSRLEHTLPIFDGTSPDDSFGRGSVLMEEDELLSEGDEYDDQVTGVKRMAIAFDSRGSASSASETSESEDALAHTPARVQKLKPQWTGESVGERWRKWESGEYAAEAHRTRKRTVSDASEASSSGAQGDIEPESSPQLEKPNPLGDERHDEDDLLKGGTVKAPPRAQSAHATDVSLLPIFTPPPPYTSAFPANEDVPTSLPVSPASQSTPNGTPTRPRVRNEDGKYSVTPTPERPKAHTSGLGIRTPESPDHTPSKSAYHAHLSATGTDNPYATLRGSPDQPRYPTGTIRSAYSAFDEEEEEEGSLQPASHGMPWVAGSRWTTARRVTIRPAKVQSLFDQNGEVDAGLEHPGTAGDEADAMSGDKRIAQEEMNLAKEVEVENKMEQMMERIRELEQKLDAATTAAHVLPASSTDATPTPAPARTEPTGEVSKDLVPPRQAGKSRKDRSILDLLGLGSSPRDGGEDDGLPRRVRELPAYLFFVGVGVGAIMVRVLIGRSR